MSRVPFLNDLDEKCSDQLHVFLRRFAQDTFLRLCAGLFCGGFG
ncbi:MAG: hypothetical protein FMNOHCHN_03658 [Ignavibacteriaceae bacterium]|nr:hypothetical protein [Ignavibacteriaceae bacterium]